MGDILEFPRWRVRYLLGPRSRIITMEYRNHIISAVLQQQIDNRDIADGWKTLQIWPSHQTWSD